MDNNQIISGVDDETFGVVIAIMVAVALFAFVFLFGLASSGSDLQTVDEGGTILEGELVPAEGPSTGLIPNDQTEPGESVGTVQTF